jgi:hypothetical protein
MKGGGGKSAAVFTQVTTGTGEASVGLVRWLDVHFGGGRGKVPVLYGRGRLRVRDAMSPKTWRTS